MILIVARNNDVSAGKVVEWLRTLRADFICLNNPNTRIIKSICINDATCKVRLDQAVISEGDLCAVSVIWFRRGWIDFKLDPVYDALGSKFYMPYVESHIREENKNIDYLVHQIMAEKCINNPNRYEVHKMETLRDARSVGLSVPKTIITDRRDEVMSYFEGHEMIVTKPVTDNLIIDHGNFKQSHRVRFLERGEVLSLPVVFGVSLFQEYIECDLEIRLFFFLGKCFSIARVKGDLGGRVGGQMMHDSTGQMIRVLPFDVPKEVTDKLIRLMLNLKLESGSVDLIVERDTGEYVFLEVNPVGQFDFVSYLGNYHIEKYIAEQLIRIDHGAI